MKTVIVFDHDTGEMSQMPIDPGGFLTICEPPMRLVERIDNAEDGTVTLKLKLVTLPVSEEGKNFLDGGAA